MDKAPVLRQVEEAHRLEQPMFSKAVKAKAGKARHTLLLREVTELAQRLPLGSLPDLLGELAAAEARVRWTVEERTRQEGSSDPLMTVKQVAAWAGIDEGTVHRWARGKWNPAVRMLGEGTLRFDPATLRRLAAGDE